jgi:hypothetical protein
VRVSDLAEFLLARIAEDEHCARLADTGEKWESAQVYGVDGVIDFKPSVPGSHLGDRVMGDHNDSAHAWMSLYQSGHIAHWDPDRVLAECEAKRRIIERHKPNPGGFIVTNVNKGEGHRAPLCTVCVVDRDDYWENWTMEPWPCPTLRDLGEVYADHPDYPGDLAAVTDPNASR